MIAMRPRLLFLISFTCLALGATAGAADDTLASAKDLYRSAAYDEALAMLDRMTDATAAGDRLEATEYKVFCLIALDRKTEARSAIEAMVSADPFYQLPVDRASPRVRSVFEEVRRSLLPGIVQRTYAEAKAAFDKQDPRAAAQFERVVNLLNDPDLKDNAALADLRTVAGGFRDLSAALVNRTPSPAVPVPAVARLDATASKASASNETPITTAPSEIVYREGEPDVVPPVIIDQTMPKWAPPVGGSRGNWQGTLEVVIDESGNVVSAAMRKPVHPTYDYLLLKAAQSWKYRPATKNGVPGRYIKFVVVRLSATN